MKISEMKQELIKFRDKKQEILKRRAKAQNEIEDSMLKQRQENAESEIRYWEKMIEAEQ